MIEPIQYLSIAFTEELRKSGLIGSVGTVGDALDNAVMESTIGPFKTEVITHENSSWQSSEQVEAATISWVQWHNHQWLHSAIGHILPAEYENIYYHRTHCHDTTIAA